MFRRCNSLCFDGLLGLLYHHPSESGDTLRDLEAGQLPDLGASEPVDGVGADFKRQLATVQHLFLERVCLFLQVGLGFLPGAEQRLEDLGKQTLATCRFQEQVVGRCLGVLVRLQIVFLYLSRL